MLEFFSALFAAQFSGAVNFAAQLPAIITPAIIAVFVFGFFCELMDSTVGMGYGTTIVPALLLAGFSPLQIVPAVLVSQTAAGFAAAFFHHKEGNVNFRRGERDLKIALVLASCSVIGAVTAVALAVRLPEKTVQAFIGGIVIATGLFIFAQRHALPDFSWKKIVGLGTFASFNKGLSGGGYGPVVVSGQILSGVGGKNAIGITALAEAITSITAVFAYLAFSGGKIDLSLAPVLVSSALLSVPLSARAVKKMEAKTLTKLIAVFAVVLGSVTLAKALWF